MGAVRIFSMKGPIVDFPRAFYLKIKSPIHGRRKDFFHEGTNSGFSKGNCCVFP